MYRINVNVEMMYLYLCEVENFKHKFYLNFTLKNGFVTKGEIKIECFYRTNKQK